MLISEHVFAAGGELLVSKIKTSTCVFLKPVPGIKNARNFLRNCTCNQAI